MICKAKTLNPPELQRRVRRPRPQEMKTARVGGEIERIGSRHGSGWSMAFPCSIRNKIRKNLMCKFLYICLEYDKCVIF